MPRQKSLARLALALVLIGSLTACAVVPGRPVAYRSTPVYVESYPTYNRHGYPHGYYEQDRRYYDHRDEHQYRGEPRRHEEPRRMVAPLPNPVEVHRDIRRSLGLPRPPGLR